MFVTPGKKQIIQVLRKENILIFLYRKRARQRPLKKKKKITSIIIAQRIKGKYFMLFTKLNGKSKQIFLTKRPSKKLI